MNITWYTPEWDGSARTKVYPRIGGGSRIKDFGFESAMLTLTGHALLEGEADVAELEAYARTRQVQQITLAYGNGVSRVVEMVLKNVRYRMLGAGYALVTATGYALESVAVEATS